MPSVKPAVRAALVSLLSAAPALEGIDVRYGYGYTDAQEGRALMVGATDPFAAAGEDTVDSSTQAWAATGLNAPRDETGDLQCVAMSWNGNPGQLGVQQAYEDAYAIAATVETYLRGDMTLGGLAGLLWVEFGTDSAAREFDDSGPVCLLQFSVHYRARF